MSIGGIISILALQDLLVAQGVDECSSACWHLVAVLRVSLKRASHTRSRGTAHHQTKLNPLLDIFLASDLLNKHFGSVTVEKNSDERTVHSRGASIPLSYATVGHDQITQLRVTECICDVRGLIRYVHTALSGEDMATRVS